MDDWKVVWTDGYNRDYVADRTVADRLDRLDAEIIRDRLRAESWSESDWWIIMPQDKPISRGMEDHL